MNKYSEASGIERFEPPGGILVWIIVALELLTFGAGLSWFMAQAGEYPELFASGRAALNQPIALCNTLILLSGGWCMANSITALRRGQLRPACRWAEIATLTGLAFIVLKGIEYSQKLQHGIGLGYDTFYTLYYLLTIFHLLHVFVAVILLLAMRWGIKRGKYNENHHQDVESSAIFWHMCDLIWLLLYPVIYLLH